MAGSVIRRLNGMWGRTVLALSVLLVCGLFAVWVLLQAWHGYLVYWHDVGSQLAR
jgi:hypothetical protein